MKKEENFKKPFEVLINKDGTGCKCCCSLHIEEGYDLDLCTHCRDKLSKRNFPIWVMVFSGVIVSLLIFSLVNLLTGIKACIAYQRAEQAVINKNYNTAVKEYKKVTEIFAPAKIHAKLFMAQVNNLEIDEALETYKLMDGRYLEYQTIKEITDTHSKIERYYLPYSGSYKVYEKQNVSSREDFINALREYTEHNLHDVFTMHYLADILFDMKNYDEVEMILNKILEKYSDMHYANLLMADLCIVKGEFSRAVDYCNYVLEDNKENISALGIMARIEFKMGNNTEGLEIAKKAYEIDPEGHVSISTIALAYHYNGMIEERDKMFEVYKNLDNPDPDTLELLSTLFKK